MENYSLSEVIELAVQTEILGNRFYTAMSGKYAKDAELKDLFQSLALKEKQHEKVFTALKDSRGQETPDNWEEAAKYLRAIAESEFFLGGGKSLSLQKKVKTRADAVRSALGFEKETLLYYLGIREVIGEKKELDRIIAEEKQHILWLSELKKKL